MATSEDRVYPFDCGSQMADWQDRNCHTCTKFDNCDIDTALLEVMVLHGYVTPEIGERMGYTAAAAAAVPHFPYSWECPEKVAR